SLPSTPLFPYTTLFRSMVAFSMAVMPTGLVWGAIYYVLGETTAAAVPIAYMPFAAANLAAFARTRDLDQVRRGQCLLILSLPFRSEEHTSELQSRGHVV